MKRALGTLALWSMLYGIIALYVDPKDVYQHHFATPMAVLLVLNSLAHVYTIYKLSKGEQTNE